MSSTAPRPRFADAPTRSNPTRHAARVAIALLLAATTGCAANHAFPSDGTLDVPSLAAKLDAQPDGAEALFDLTYWPLLHLDLQTFARNDERPSYPEGHELVSVRSWLPFFLFVDGNVELLDTEHVSYERSEFMAILWGLWTRNRTTVETRHGARTDQRGRFLWVLDWEDSVEYAQSEATPLETAESLVAPLPSEGLREGADYSFFP